MAITNHAILPFLLCFLFHLLPMSLSDTAVPPSLPSPNLSSKDLLNHLLPGTSSDVNLSALFVFGDSWTANKYGGDGYHYGVDFHSKNNVEYSNGRSTADFIAQLGGFPSVPNESKQDDIRNGVNYASSGCGVLPATKGINTCLTLDQQIDSFEKTVNQDLKSRFNSSGSLANYLSKSLSLVLLGNNDFFSNLDENGSHHSPEDFAKILAEGLSTRLRRIYNIGARKFLVGNVNPAGCQPLYREYDHTCDQEINSRISLYNKHLPQILKDLESSLPQSEFTLLDINKVFEDVFAAPESYGITNTNEVCYDEYKVFLCEDRKQYVYFDHNHPTEIMHYLMFYRCLNDSSICTPHSLIQLLQAK